MEMTKLTVLDDEIMQAGCTCEFLFYNIRYIE